MRAGLRTADTRTYALPCSMLPADTACSTTLWHRATSFFVYLVQHFALHTAGAYGARRIGRYIAARPPWANLQFRAVSFHSEVWGGAPTEIEFGSLHFSFKIRRLLAAILMIFPRINLPNFVQFKQY